MEGLNGLARVAVGGTDSANGTVGGKEWKILAATKGSQRNILSEPFDLLSLRDAYLL